MTPEKKAERLFRGLLTLEELETWDSTHQLEVGPIILTRQRAYAHGGVMVLARKGGYVICLFAPWREGEWLLYDDLAVKYLWAKYAPSRLQELLDGHRSHL